MSDYLTPEQAIENAPADCAEEDVEGVFGGKVRVRALTAAQMARVKQASVKHNGRSPDVAWGEMEMAQFLLGVVAPKFTPDQVRSLHLASGPSFAKVIAAIDKLSKLDKEELRATQQEFPGSNNGSAVEVHAGA